MTSCTSDSGGPSVLEVNQISKGKGKGKGAEGKSGSKTTAATTRAKASHSRAAKGMQLQPPKVEERISQRMLMQTVATTAVAMGIGSVTVGSFKLTKLLVRFDKWRTKIRHKGQHLAPAITRLPSTQPVRHYTGMAKMWIEWLSTRTRWSSKIWQSFPSLRLTVPFVWFSLHVQNGLTCLALIRMIHGLVLQVATSICLSGTMYDHVFTYGVSSRWIQLRDYPWLWCWHKCFTTFVWWCWSVLQWCWASRLHWCTGWQTWHSRRTSCNCCLREWCHPAWEVHHRQHQQPTSSYGTHCPCRLGVSSSEWRHLPCDECPKHQRQFS